MTSSSPAPTKYFQGIDFAGTIHWEINFRDLDQKVIPQKYP